MPKDSSLKDNLQVLDNVLSFLIDKKEYKTEINTLVSSVYNIQLNLIKPDKPESSITLEDIIKRSDVKDKTLYKVEKSLLYLEELGLVKSNDNYYVSLTYQGIIKYSDGFVKEYDKQSYDKIRLLNVENFQQRNAREMFWITFLIMIGTLVSALYYILEMISSPYCFCK